MAVIDLTHRYAAPPDRLWALVTDFDALADVCKPLLLFEGLPSGRCKTGQQLDVKVSLFGKLPAQPYHMELLECDDDAMVMRTSETGAGVRSWRHTLRVEPDGTGSQLHDYVEIDAGLLSPVFGWWARKLYRHRHKPRQKLLGEA